MTKRVTGLKVKFDDQTQIIEGRKTLLATVLDPGDSDLKIGDRIGIFEDEYKKDRKVIPFRLKK